MLCLLLVFQAVCGLVCLVVTVHDFCLPGTFFLQQTVCAIKDLIYFISSKAFGVMETLLLH